MPVTHVNRKRDTYYLHAGKTKTGKPRYWFSKTTEGDLVKLIPEGYEVYENPDAQVFLRKIADLQPTLYEDHAVHARKREGTYLPSPAVVLPGLDRPLDRSLGVRQRREALRSG
jgi:hypothetical protein